MSFYCRKRLRVYILHVYCENSSYRVFNRRSDPEEQFILWRILPSFENFFNLLSIIIRGKEICLDRIVVPRNEDGMHYCVWNIWGIFSYCKIVGSSAVFLIRYFHGSKSCYFPVSSAFWLKKLWSGLRHFLRLSSLVIYN